MVIRRGWQRPRSLSPLKPRSPRERRRIEFLGIGAFTIFIFLIALSFFASGSHRLAIRSPQVAAVVSSVLAELANGDRVSNSLAALRVNPVLVAVAQAKANDMATYGYFAHVSPAGVDPWHWFENVGYKFDHAGENLAVDFSDSGDVERAWMMSSLHRENILNSNFTEIGIATAQGMYQGRPTTFVVQAFGSPSVDSATQKKGKTATILSSQAERVASTTQNSARVVAVEGTQVLGSTANEAKQVPLSPQGVKTSGEKRAKTSGVIATTSPSLAAALVKDISDIPPWAYAISFPRDTLRYVYYVVGFLVLVVLVIETGLEIRWHHLKHAARTGILLAMMYALFVVADYLFFAQPVLAALVSSQ